MIKFTISTGYAYAIFGKASSKVYDDKEKVIGIIDDSTHTLSFTSTGNIVLSEDDNAKIMQLFAGSTPAGKKL